MHVMRMATLGLVAFACVAFFGCSDSDSKNGAGSSSSSGSSGGSSGSSGSSGTTDQCKIAPGTYTIHYTKTGGLASCQEIPDQTFTMKETDGGTADAGTNPNCTSTTDTASCTTTTDCTFKQQGYTTTSKNTFTSKNGSVSGTSSTKTVKDSDGSVVYDCSYSQTWTKQ